jgi:hypothetical protein
MAKRNEVATENSNPAAPLDGEVLAREAPIAPASARRHRATFATDNIEGGYMVRIEGPDCAKFAKRTGIPVTRFDGSETAIDLKNLVWSGNDLESGKPVALYKIVKHPRAKADAEAAAF